MDTHTPIGAVPSADSSPNRGDNGGNGRRSTVSFSRRSARLTDRQARAWDQHAATYVLDIPRGAYDTSVDPSYVFDAAATFGRHAPLVVEIGTGRGEAILHAAHSQPDTDFLGLEVWVTGIAKTFVTMGKAEPPNLRIALVDAFEALSTMLAAGSVAELRIFFPDPWHKTRHHKRRLIDDEFAALAVRVLAPQGILRLATDWEEYALQMREVLDRTPGLQRAHEAPWAERFAGRPITRFEHKGQQVDREIRDLTYRAAST
ncbi:MAG: tRNA ((46)-N7)-methyltransferase TrmB [Nocardioidaceae bacterium]|nr:tRNA ((46)-N7)-methyltransferase TrmB [Nocardioidaceae bacterium]